MIERAFIYGPLFICICFQEYLDQNIEMIKNAETDQ